MSLQILGCVQIPTKEQVSGLSEELQARSRLPLHVLKVLESLPEGTHPMTQLSTAVLALQVCCDQKYNAAHQHA